MVSGSAAGYLHRNDRSFYSFRQLFGDGESSIAPFDK
jgi:hypothetical protein